MAAVTVAFDGTRINSADATTGWEDYDGSMFSGGTEEDFIYQGTFSISIKVSSTARNGIGYDDTGTVNFTSPRRAFLAKVIATNSGVLNNKGATGGNIYISSGGLANNTNIYYVVGGDTYPVKGGWLIVPIDPNVTPSSTTGGGAAETAIDGYGWACEFSANSKSQNVAMDAIDYIPFGGGMTLTRGDGADTDGVFQDFVDYDENKGATDGGRYGVVSTQDGVLYVTGTLNIGDTGAAGVTEFTDSAQVLVFPEAEFIGAAGFFGVDVDASQASTAVSISDSVFKSEGTEAGNGDTRPTYDISGTAGSVTYTGNLFDTFNTFTGTSALTLENCIFLSGEQVTLGGATADGCSFSGDTNAVDNGYVVTSDLSDISNCNFTYNSGAHAIEITSAAGSPYTFTGNTFTGYAAGSTGTFTVTGPADAAIYNSSGAAITISVVGGTTPSIRNSVGSQTTVQADVTVTVEVQDAATNVIPDARVAIYQVSDDSEVSNSLTNTSGIITTSTGQNTDLYIRVRKSSNSQDSISNIAGTGTVTVDTTANHGLATGQTVTISGTTNFNGTFGPITVTDANTFTYSDAGNASPETTGTVTLETRYIPVETIGNSGASGLSLTVTLSVDGVAL